MKLCQIPNIVNNTFVNVAESIGRPVNRTTISFRIV